jgi:hypothetical protein
VIRVYAYDFAGFFPGPFLPSAGAKSGEKSQQGIETERFFAYCTT